jgi:hypothetical protein
MRTTIDWVAFIRSPTPAWRFVVDYRPVLYYFIHNDIH